MRINPQNIYKDSYVNDFTDATKIDKSRQRDVQSNVNLSKINNKNLITKTERDFFINMFPENTEQLRKHILFNQNGKVHTPNISKGTIVDGRV